MTPELDTLRPSPEAEKLPDDFVDRLGDSLRVADRGRRRHLWLARLQRLVVVCLLVGPVVGWHLMEVSPGGPHVYVDALAWLAFFLDVGVHADTAVLSFLGLQPLPSIVGFLLLVLLTVTLLTETRRDRS
jgi:hypothetical protein